MIKKRNISSVSFIGFVFSVMLCANSYAGNNPQRIGYSKIYPSTFGDWPTAFLSGNGKMGIMVFGNPLNETVIFNDRKFFMAASNERKFNQVSASDLEAIRNFYVSENWSEMLVSSNSGTLELLPALTQSLHRGIISGIKARNRVTVEQLSWDMTKGIIECKLKSDIDQNITLIERSGIDRIVSKTKVSLSPAGSIARIVQLKAGKSTNFSIRIIQ